MNGLVSAAVEADAILSRARWSNRSAESSEDFDSDRDSILENDIDLWREDDHKRRCPINERYSVNYNRKRSVAHHVYLNNSHSPVKRERPSPSLSPVKKSSKFNIHEKLRELYDELSSNEALQNNYQGLKLNSYLLEKLLSRMNLNVLIINLYPGNKGYSISIKMNGDTQLLSPPISDINNEVLLETARWPYEEEDLLTYIDNEELPIVLLDLLEADYSCLFYSGCIIAQIRDYRQAYPSFVCDTHHVLLKPTTQSIINDVNAIAKAGTLTREERLLLESAMVLATAPPLCLEPTPAVGLLAAKLNHQKHILSTPAIRRQARKFSQVAVNRKRRLDQLTQHHGLGLLDIINKYRSAAIQGNRLGLNNLPTARTTSKYPKKPSEVLRAVLAPIVENPILSVPADVGATVARLAKVIEKQRPSPDCAPQLLEEYVLETERAPSANGINGTSGQPGVFHIKLSILQRPSNQEFLGELYVDRDHVEGERNGSACRFLLGTRSHANRYIQQFTEIFTEEGRKSVRIKHFVPGQQPRITYTAAMREISHSQQMALQARNQQNQTNNVSSGTPNPNIQPVINGAMNQIGSAGTVKVTPVALPSPSPSTPITATPSPEVVLVTGTPNAGRRTISTNLPLLQAQLQAGPATVQQLQNANQVTNSTQVLTPIDQSNLKSVNQQPTATIQHIQLHQSTVKHNNDQSQQIHNAQQTANQLLAQQLTNPPQPINPHKVQQAIIHIPHPLTSQLLQQKIVTSQAQIQGQAGQLPITIQTQGQQGITLQTQQGVNIQQQNINLQNSNLQIQNQTNTVQAQIQKIAPPKQRTTNPAITALVTSLMNSAQQFQQATAAAKSNNIATTVSSTSSNNATILNLLNSAPAAMTNTAPSSSLNDIGVNKKQTSTPSALLERLMAPPVPAQVTQNTQQSLGLMPGLQNVQVQIPGLAQPISLSLNVSAAGGQPAGLLVSVPVSQQTTPSTQSLLSLPITHLMTSGMKTGTPLQLVQRPRVAPRQLPTKLPSAGPGSSGTVQYITNQQPINNIVHQQRRRSNPGEPNK